MFEMRMYVSWYRQGRFAEKLRFQQRPTETRATQADSWGRAFQVEGKACANALRQEKW